MNEIITQRKRAPYCKRAVTILTIERFHLLFFFLLFVRVKMAAWLNRTHLSSFIKVLITKSMCSSRPPFLRVRTKEKRTIGETSLLVNLTKYRTPLRTLGPLLYQRSACKGSESTNSLHKLILPENVFISNFGGMKMYEKCKKVMILVNFDQFSELLRTPSPPIISKKYL